MSLGDQIEFGEKREVSPQAKLQALTEILPEVASNSQFMLSGSLAAIISEKLKDGECQITHQDLAKVNDLDIATTLWSIDGLKEKSQEITEKTGVDLEVNPVMQNCAYPDSPAHELAVAKAKVLLPDSQAYIVSYTTPEFLLLSLIDQPVGEKTPPDKYRSKVLNLTNLPSFFLDKFKQLVHHELAVRNSMNRDTFRLWKQQVLKDGGKGAGFADYLAREYSKVNSLVDQGQLFNLARSREELETLEFEDVRTIPQIERFLREIEDDEEQPA